MDNGRLGMPGKGAKKGSWHGFCLSGLKTQDYSERLKELNMVTVSARREELDMVEIYKIVAGKSDVYANSWFEKVNAEGVMTRQAAEALKVKIPVARLEVRKNFFSVRVCEKWNSIPVYPVTVLWNRNRKNRNFLTS
jgi:hypothetical protein